MREENWVGPLDTNGQVDMTLTHWQTLENNVPDVVRVNYRFEMSLMRAYYDGYIKNRLIYETDLESLAMAELGKASQIGYSQAVGNAESILRNSYGDPQNLRQRCFELADSLFMDIGSQLTVDRHGAQSRRRGAFMDGIDEPLNNVNWLFSQFDNINDLGDVEAILNRTNPGPGGFYDNMGDPGWRNRVVNDIPWEVDPGTLISPRISFFYDTTKSRYRDYPLAWWNQVTALYQLPLVMAYENLDPGASYRLKIAYTGDRSRRMRLVADDQYEIHDSADVVDDRLWEFSVPQAATVDGDLVLTWTCSQGQRASQVSEIWLIKQ